jgi:hypothetical protein
VINASGAVAGSIGGGGPGQQGFVEAGGVTTLINAPGSPGTGVTGLNDSGAVSGSFLDGSGIFEGFVESGGTYTVIDPPGSDNNTVAYRINNSGAVVGYFQNDAGLYEGFIATPVPAPATWATMLAGFGGLAYLGSRRAKRAVSVTARSTHG